MRSIKTSEGTFLICETIKELTIDRYNDFNKFLVQASGIGSDMQSVNSHFLKFDTFLANGKIDEARAERYNLHFNLVMMLNGINIDSMAFATLVDTIGDEKITDYTEAGLERVCAKLAKIKLGRGEMEELLTEIKKKLLSS